MGGVALLHIGVSDLRQPAGRKEHACDGSDPSDAWLPTALSDSLPGGREHPWGLCDLALACVPSWRLAIRAAVQRRSMPPFSQLFSQTYFVFRLLVTHGRLACDSKKK